MTWQLPETRPSIILRVQDPSDHEAWAIFEGIYRTAIFRAARRRGLQDADADDVTQTVLVKLAQRGRQFVLDSNGARFRTWLGRVTENAIVDYQRRQPHATVALIHESDVNDRVEDQLELEYRREVFRWAARIIRSEFSTDAWKSFWLTAVENRPINEVASDLNRTVASVYTNRSRVMRRLRLQVTLFDDALDGEL